MAPTSSRFPKSHSALLILDVINPLEFRGGARFLPTARRCVRRIRRLAERARAARVPVIFVNDNRGRWRSHIEQLIDGVKAGNTPGALLPDILRPEDGDFVVLKSTLSGFHQTALEAMLRLGGVRKLVITGLVTGNCVLFTAADAYMLDYEIIVPADCVADLKASEHKAALAKMRGLFKAATPSRSSQIRVRR